MLAAAKGERLLLVPDKDADGLCAASIVYRTLRLLDASAGTHNIHAYWDHVCQSGSTDNILHSSTHNAFVASAGHHVRTLMRKSAHNMCTACDKQRHVLYISTVLTTRRF